MGPRKIGLLPVLFEVRKRCLYTSGVTSNCPISNVVSIDMGWLSCSQEVNFPTSTHITSVPRSRVCTRCQDCAWSSATTACEVMASRLQRLDVDLEK